MIVRKKWKYHQSPIWHYQILSTTNIPKIDKNLHNLDAGVEELWGIFLTWKITEMINQASEKLIIILVLIGHKFFQFSKW